MQPLRLGAAAAALAGAGLLLVPPCGPAAARNALTTGALSVPAPQEVHARSAPVRQNRTALIPFATAPFPYDGHVAGTDEPFLNVEEDGRRGHKTPFGRLYWEDETYADSRVLLHVPKGFDVRKPSIMIVYFHGHGATLRRDVLRRQRLPTQVTAAGVNAVLVAPQLAVDAADSSAGKFWEPGAFGRFIGEAAQKLGKLHGDPRAQRTFAQMPVVLVAYSGGYLAAASCATQGGVTHRVRGLILLDALYGEIGKFASWIARNRSAFLVSTYLSSTESKNAELGRILADNAVAFETALQPRLEPGSVTIFPSGSEEVVDHRDLVTHAWVENPVADLLRRLRQYRR